MLGGEETQLGGEEEGWIDGEEVSLNTDLKKRDTNLPTTD